MNYQCNKKKLYELCDIKILYFLITGLSYREIAEKYYSYQFYKFNYKVRKLKKELNVQNRRQLTYCAIKNQLIEKERILEYI